MVNYTDKIISDHTIMLGKPVIKGTRITVEFILKKLGQGATFNDLILAYPTLTSDDIYASLIYAADMIANEEVLIPNK